MDNGDDLFHKRFLLKHDDLPRQTRDKHKKTRLKCYRFHRAVFRGRRAQRYHAKHGGRSRTESDVARAAGARTDGKGGAWAVAAWVILWLFW